MDVMKFKLNHYTFQFWISIWTHDNLTFSFNNTTFIKGPITFIIKKYLIFKTYNNGGLLGTFQTHSKLQKN